MTQDDDAISRSLTAMQVIIVALTAGPLLLLAIVVFLRSAGPARPPALAPPTQVFLTNLAMAFAVVLLPISVLIPQLIARRARKQVARGTWTPPASVGTQPFGDSLRLTMVRQRQLFVGATINEFVAFLAAIAYFVEGTPLTLGLTLVLIVGVAARFPTRTTLGKWIDAQSVRIAEEKPFDFQ